MQISGNSNTLKPFSTVPQTESAFQSIDHAAAKVKYAFMIDILCRRNAECVRDRGRKKTMLSPTTHSRAHLGKIIYS